MNTLCATALLLLTPAESLAPSLYQNTPLFNIKATPVESEDICDVLLQYYDERKGRWVGYGLFSISREADGSIRARIPFQAPTEGVYRLRTVAVDRAGNVEKASEDPDTAEVMAVYDATPPVVELILPRGGERLEAPGAMDIKWITHDAHPARKSAVRVLLSLDGGLNFEEIAGWQDLMEEIRYDLPDVTSHRAVVAVEVKDLAGNVGRTESGLFNIAGSKRMETVYEATPQRVTPATPAGPAPWTKERPEPGVEIPATRKLAKRFYTRGVIYLVRGDYDEAQRELTSALQADPDYLPARIDLGIALVKMGRVKQALQFLHNSMQSYPDEPDLPFNAAVIYYNAGDYAEALKLVKRVLQLDPERIEALWTAADCAVRLGDVESATHWWLEIVSLTSPVNRYHAKALAYLKEAGVDIERLKAIRGPALLITPSRVLQSDAGAEEPSPEMSVSPVNPAALPEPELPLMEEMKTSPAGGGVARFR